ncbi:2085_t:CDS:10 [Ambispora leptoticha]|uniref:non-specific serine/threonine protein kinase n=1 Tax=Ambispora leptoticha TaxID=144679 RepID=A0A9N8VS52_9GLOM|nr:2085_t:CDS:10 [Ambispora leptoticha]
MDNRGSNGTSSLMTTEIGVESAALNHTSSNVSISTNLEPVSPINFWNRRGSTSATSYHSGSSVASSGDEEKPQHYNHQSVNLSSDSHSTSKKKKGLRLSLKPMRATATSTPKSPLQTPNSNEQNNEGSISQSFSHASQVSSTTSRRDSLSVDYSSDPQHPPDSPQSPGNFFSKNPSINTAHGFEVKETHTINKEYDPTTGKKMINKYMLIREVGRGVHGKVKLGRDMETDELVAIKIVDRTPRRRLGQRQNEPSNEQKIRKEIAILKKCAHPHVVSLKEVIDDPMSKKIYMVLEYMEGGEIQWKDENDNPIMDIEDSRRIFRDVVLGLEYLHHQGIIHRDIKPANLLLTADHVVKISDFGVSHFNQQRVAAAQDNGAQNFASGNDTELAKTAGSPAFFAPELCFTGDIPPDFTSSSIVSAITNHDPTSSPSIVGPSSPTTNRSMHRPPITKAIDIWALGVTLYCFIFGRCPFIADTEFELFFDVIPRKTLEFPENVEIPNDLKDLFMRLLEKDPSKRITLEEVKKHPWVVADLPNPDKWREDTDPKKYQAVTVTDDEVKGAYTLIDRLKKKFRKLSVSLGNLALGFRKRSKSVSGPSTQSEGDSQSGIYGSSLPETSSARRRISKDLENYGIDYEDQQTSFSSSSSRSTLGISPTTSSQNTVVAVLDHYTRPSSRSFASKRKSNNSHSSLNQSWQNQNQNHNGMSSGINGGDSQNNLTDSDEDDGGVVFVANALRHHHQNPSNHST